MKTHSLKTWPGQFRAIINGEKTFEFRKNDREFNEGEILSLKEWNPKLESYTGLHTEMKVIFILYGPSFGIPEGYCIMSIQSLICHCCGGKLDPGEAP